MNQSSRAMPGAPVLIVGAGIGGLAAALRLSAAGLPVTVLERAAGPGGKMRTLPSDAGPVDAGPTVLTMRHVFDDLFEASGARLDDHVTLRRQEILARHWWPDGATLDLHADPEASAAAVRGFAGPRAEKEFRRFSQRAARLFAAFDAPMMRTAQPSVATLTRKVMAQPALIPLMAPNSSLAQVLAKAFSDPRLAQLFGRYATYVGGSPYQSPGILALVWQAEAAGVWTVTGGMHALARAIADLAAARGVQFRYDAEVTEVETGGGRASGVRLADGTRLAGRAVLFNGDPRALSLGLLGQPIASAAPETARAERSLSARVYAFAANAQGLPLVHHNVFFCADPRAEFDDLRAGRFPRDPTIYLCAEDRGQETPPAGLERFEIIMNAPPLPYADAPEQETAPCPTQCFETLGRFGLNLTPVPDKSALTTPTDFEALFPGSAGSLYGQSPHGLMAAFQRPVARSAVPGLYLAGGGTHPGAGVPMATLSARHAAAAILTDLASTSTSRPTVTPGGTSTG
ncbi:methoxyneurosporene dehydrogenase [Meridianimarinicoccus roseus]|uniref:Methoxyneurosporene dehydrogenase n=1 Tax=Meridianimarinicoccus roseus TaxID=2072018 RepID=A0A2V2LBU1_9RHOB|nr:1-hydroxycarotenoid 3,4-desaturase CrtD [Meridianimarinicoccus roseus]PWR02980.1 methoxyneurosporene dehydrogenase [Meridianimarinicoccus roseus]